MACTVPDLDYWLRERETMTALLRQHLLRAQDRMKKQADKHRQERSFEVGDLVYLKLQPYVQTSLAPRSSQKLAFKFFGPYKILARVGEVAYRLELPASSKIHNMVHVSQLKRHLPTTVPVSDDPGLLCLDEFVLLQPAEVMARKQIKHGGSMISRVLVRWLGLPATTVT
jgi:ribosomal protein L21E